MIYTGKDYPQDKEESLEKHTTHDKSCIGVWKQSSFQGHSSEFEFELTNATLPTPHTTTAQCTPPHMRSHSHAQFALAIQPMSNPFTSNPVPIHPKNQENKLSTAPFNPLIALTTPSSLFVPTWLFTAPVHASSHLFTCSPFTMPYPQQQ